jgi:glycosyltransferase involved in cell wall biosynthesis
VAVPRRLLLVSYYYPPDPSVGSHRWAAMVPYLRESGFEVKVVTTGFFGALPDDFPNVVRTADLRTCGPLRSALRRPPVEEQALSTPVPTLLGSGPVPDAFVLSWVPFAAVAARRLLRAEHFDCVVTNGPPHSTHLVGLMLGRDRPAWIADFEDPWRFEPPRGPWPTRVQDRLDAALEARVARSAEMLVAVAAPVAAEFTARLGADARHIPLAWDPGLEPTVASATPPELPPGRINLVHTGALTVPLRRDPTALFEALARLVAEAPDLARRVCLVVAGVLSEDERKILARPPLDGVVEVLGLLSRADTVALQRRADALVLIATGEYRAQLVGKLFEYLASGRPIIAIADENEAARIVEATGSGVVVAPSDLDGLVAILREAATTGLGRHYNPRGLDRYRFPAPAIEFAEAVEAAVARRSRRERTRRSTLGRRRSGAYPPD